MWQNLRASRQLMSLGPGDRLGPYAIQAAIGAGGMGEVYRARDTRLKRDVALKILPESFATDVDRLTRFQREAEVLASLNHWHIAAIHGVEDSGDIRALVMELVDGDTLAERLQRGPMQIEETLRVAIQIAEALEAAHERGVVHRDLKPANIKINSDGNVKVLDFGLAKALESDRVTANVSHSPTLSMMATQAGMILGTAAYMSPEQANGFPADQRSDVFSFGCVLYEMLTARQAFQGNTAAEVLASVLVREPDLTALPADVNPRLRDLVRRCLDKNPKRRWQAVGDVRMELESIAAQPRATTDRAMPAVPLWRRALPLIATAVVAGLTAAGGTWLALRPLVPRVSRLAIDTSAQTGPTINGADRDLSITGDGTRVVYVGDRGRQLFVRPLDALQPTAIFAGAPRGPFVSPDGQWVGFIDSVNVLKKVAITGGPAVTVANLLQGSRGAVWAPDDTIIFATTDIMTGLQRVSASGGTIDVLTRPDHARGEADHLWPEMLPGGRYVLFTIAVSVFGSTDAAQIAVFDLQGRTTNVLIRGGSHARYVSSGHLVYTAGGTLRAVAFDPARLEVRGVPVPVIPQVAVTAAGGVDAVVADDGTLAYVAGGAFREDHTLVWVDREGHETAITAVPRPYSYPRISPDGGRLAVWSQDQENDIWLWDFAQLTLTRATFAPALDAHPVWSRDGKRLAFSSEREGARNIFWQATDGTGTVERLTRSNAVENATSISPDGAHIIFSQAGNSTTNEDVMEVEAGGEHRVRPLVQSPFGERNGVVSSDGRWLAYEGLDSARPEIYVRPYPDVDSGRWQVSSTGGTRPLWSRDSRELFFVGSTSAIMRVGIESGTSWSATTPTMIIKEGYVTQPQGNPGRNYDISPDGQRFLLVKPSAERDTAPPALMVVQNWGEELKRLVPRK